MFRLTAFRISSIDMKMMMMLRRDSTPATPTTKSRKLSMRKLMSVGSKRLTGAACAGSIGGRSESRLRRVHRKVKRQRQQQGDDDRRPCLPCIELYTRFFFGARLDQHDDEQEQHHDAADIDQYLHAGDEFGAQQDEQQR